MMLAVGTENTNNKDGTYPPQGGVTNRYAWTQWLDIIPQADISIQSSVAGAVSSTACSGSSSTLTALDSATSSPAT